MDEVVALTQRVGRLERENRWLKGTGGTALVGVVALLLMGQAPGKVAKVVEAEKFVLRDAAGGTRGQFAILDNGMASLRLYDKAGQANAELLALSYGAATLRLHDQKGTVRAALFAGATDNPYLRLYHADSSPRAEVAVEADGTAVMGLFDGAQKRVASMNVTNGVPAVYLAGRDGIDRAWLEVSADSPRMVFRDALQRQRLVLGEFTLFYQSGVTEHRPTSSLVMLHEDGKIVWKAP